jgi:NAD(P)-dependent dehydrogenase (short-subunit alcohol dehydrogenase family)
MTLEPLVKLRDRRVLISGATSDIGRAIALLASRLGAEVVLQGRDADQLAACGRELSGPHHSLSFDLADPTQIEAGLAPLKEIGKVSGFVHCAGLHRFSPNALENPAAVQQSLAVNLASAMEIVRVITKKSLCDYAARPSIVFLSSIAAVHGQAGVSTYSAAKAGLLGLTGALARELATRKIRVNALVVGWVETRTAERVRQTLAPEDVERIRSSYPLGFGQPDDVANATCFLLSDAARWITGAALNVDGGFLA